mmetsp:Transcript_25374/g.29381  ORF Transcript_25374/g.29381 Transcript_25374/m.29381 type:complete len:202 (+) Transcript_25374:289-894(+)
MNPISYLKRRNKSRATKEQVKQYVNSAKDLQKEYDRQTLPPDNNTATQLRRMKENEEVAYINNTKNSFTHGPTTTGEVISNDSGLRQFVWWVIFFQTINLLRGAPKISLFLSLINVITIWQGSLSFKHVWWGFVVFLSVPVSLFATILNETLVTINQKRVYSLYTALYLLERATEGMFALFCVFVLFLTVMGKIEQQQVVR